MSVSVSMQNIAFWHWLPALEGPGSYIVNKLPVRNCPCKQVANHRERVGEKLYDAPKRCSLTLLYSIFEWIGCNVYNSNSSATRFLVRHERHGFARKPAGGPISERRYWQLDYSWGALAEWLARWLLNLLFTGSNTRGVITMSKLFNHIYSHGALCCSGWLTCFRIRYLWFDFKNDHFTYHIAWAFSKLNHCVMLIDVGDDSVHSLVDRCSQLS